MIVMKFGGTSVGNVNAFEQVAAIAQRAGPSHLPDCSAGFGPLAAVLAHKRRVAEASSGRSLRLSG